MDVPQQIEQLRAEHGETWLTRNCTRLSRWVEVPPTAVARIRELFPEAKDQRLMQDHVLYCLVTFPNLFSSVDASIDHLEACAIDVTRKKNLYRMTCWRCGKLMKQNRHVIGITRRCPCTDRPS